MKIASRPELPYPIARNSSRTKAKYIYKSELDALAAVIFFLFSMKIK